MTIKEAIMTIQWDYSWCENGCKYEGTEREECCSLCVEDADTKAIEALGKAEKYKWHKRPENGWTDETLPQFDKNVLVTDGSYDWYGVWSVSNTINVGIVWQDEHGFYQVLDEIERWKYIDEEVSE